MTEKFRKNDRKFLKKRPKHFKKITKKFRKNDRQIFKK